MTRVIWTLIVGLAMLGWMGCDDLSVDEDGEEGEDPRMQVLLTSDPGEVAEARVTLLGLELVGDEETITLADEGEFGEEGSEINLRNLEDGITEALADTDVPPDVYSQLRLIVGTEEGDAHVVLADGTEPDLQLPDEPQTSIRIVPPRFGAGPNQDAEIVLDFDVASSFVQGPQDEASIFRPTVRLRTISLDGQEFSLFRARGQVEEMVDEPEERPFFMDGIPLRASEETTVKNEQGEDIPLGELSEDVFIDVDGTRFRDLLGARQVRVQPEQRAERLVRADVESVREDGLSVIGVPFEVTDETEFAALDALDELEVGDRIELVYSVEEEDEDERIERVAERIERADR